MFDFFDLTAFLGNILRLIGLLVFGISTGWFTLYAFRQPERKWQLQIAVFLGLLFFTAMTLRFSSAGGAGAFVLGAGGALLYWGQGKGNKLEPPLQTEEAE
jgi:hypothetical protein